MKKIYLIVFLIFSICLLAENIVVEEKGSLFEVEVTEEMEMEKIENEIEMYEDSIEETEEIEENTVTIEDIKTEVELENFTKEDLIEIINKGAAEWNSFREKYPDIDYKSYDFTNMDFSDKNLNGINFSNMNFRGSKFIRTELEESNFENSDISDCNFFKANLRRANLSYANARSSGFKDVVLYDAEMNETIISKIWMDNFKKKGIKNRKKINWR